MFGRRRNKIEAQLDAELQDHLDRQIADFIRSGMSREDAHRRARLLFGGSDQVKEECRDVHFGQWWAILLHDLTYAIRCLRKSPGFSAVAILVLTLAIGSNVAVFSLIDVLFLRELPVDRPAELVNIASLDKQGRTNGIPSKVLDRLRAESVFHGVCGFTTPRMTTEFDGVARSVGTLAMTGDCFESLGIHTQIGHTFSLESDKPGAERVALLTDSLWKSTFNADPNVVGKTIQTNGSVFTIIGVTQAKFTGLLLGFPPGLIVPLEQFGPPSTSSKPIYYWVSIFARRAPRISERQVQSRIAVIAQQLLQESVPMRYNEAQRRDYFARRLVVASARTGVDWMLRERFGQPLYVVLGICGSVLLIACVNLTTLMLGRGLHRQKEISVRVALGASKASLVRLVAAEIALLVLAGSATGLVLATWASRMILSNTGAMFTGFSVNNSFDSSTAIFVLGLLAVVAAVLTAAPLWQTLRLQGRLAGAGTGRGVVGSAMRHQKILLAVQVALTLALVAGSSLFDSSIQRLYTMDLGFETRGLAEGLLSPLSGGYGSKPLDAYYRDLIRSVGNIPGTSSTCLASFAPLWTMTWYQPVSAVENTAAPTELHSHPAAVSARYFETMRIPIVAGDAFSLDEQPRSERTAVISLSLAKLFGGDRIIGQHIRIGTDEQVVKVIGIAGDAQLSLENPDDRTPLTIYLNFWEQPDRQRYPALLVRTAGTAPLPASALTRAVQGLGREFVEHYITVDVARKDALIENILLAWLSSAFGVLGLILAAVGLFGVLGYHVARRTAEIGVRVALGAARSQIRWLVLRQALAIVVAGIVAGLGLTIAMGRVLTGLVFGVSVYDPRLMGVSIAVLAFTAVAAAWIPARRASSVDPVIALRQE
ncbi:MAG TPA: ADOP family duplicated permease [Bryobacteraceae bacterium]|nr:ADOP family duplicated permease [Bryobacteraceae bacterium]